MWVEMDPRNVIQVELCLLLLVFVHVTPRGHYGISGARAEIGPDLVVNTKSGPVKKILLKFQFSVNLFSTIIRSKESVRRQPTTRM